MPNGIISICVNNWYCFLKTFEKRALGARYPFGYEKSFKFKEIKQIFNEVNLRIIKNYWV